MHRNPDRSRLVRNRAGNGLTNPPGGIGGELVSALVLELFDRLHEPDISFLDEVEELEPTVRIFLCNAYDQPQVGLGQMLFRQVRPDLPLEDRANSPGDLILGHFELPFHPLGFTQCALNAFYHLFDGIMAHVQNPHRPLPRFLVGTVWNDRKDLPHSLPGLPFEIPDARLQRIQSLELLFQLCCDEIDLDSAETHLLQELEDVGLVLAQLGFQLSSHAGGRPFSDFPFDLFALLRQLVQLGDLFEKPLLVGLFFFR